MISTPSKWTSPGWWFGTWTVMNFIFRYIGNLIIPTDEVIFFRATSSPTLGWFWRRVTTRQSLFSHSVQQTPSRSHQRQYDGVGFPNQPSAGRSLWLWSFSRWRIASTCLADTSIMSIAWKPAWRPSTTKWFVFVAESAWSPSTLRPTTQMRSASSAYSCNPSSSLSTLLWQVHMAKKRRFAGSKFTRMLSEFAGAWL